MLSHQDMRSIARKSLNRAIRRRLSKIKCRDSIFLIIDATLTKRSGKKVKNSHKFTWGRTRGKSLSAGEPAFRKG